MANEENNFESDDVSRLLGSLKRVDTPGDFDFRVRARIAAGRPAVRATWLPAFGKAAAMMILLAAVAGYFGFRSYRSPMVDQASVITVPALDNEALPPEEQAANDSDTMTERDVVAPSKEQTSDPMAVRPPETHTTQPEVAVKEAVKRTGSSKRNGGSRVDAVGIANVMTAPDRTRQLSKDNLSALGIDANNTDSGWTVDVKQNSRAERSGLKTGDVIESVRNKTVRVRRGGKVVQIELKP